MANRRAHTFAGAAFGGTTASLLARDQGPGHRLLEALGGALGGTWGGRLPDLIEPALHPGHRSVAHALVPAGVAGVVGVPRLRVGQQHLWQRAEMACRIEENMAIEQRELGERLRRAREACSMTPAGAVRVFVQALGKGSRAGGGGRGVRRGCSRAGAGARRARQSRRPAL